MCKSDGHEQGDREQVARDQPHQTATSLNLIHGWPQDIVDELRESNV